MVFQSPARMVCWWLFLIVLYAAPGYRSFAQENNAPVQEYEKGLTVRVDVDEIRIDAVIVDWRGRYLTDLTAEDFEIYQDGEPQEITSCRYVSYDLESRDADVSDEKEISDLPAASPRILKKEDVRRTLVFLADNLMMSFENVYYTRMALTKFVEEQMQPGDLIAILSTSKGYLGPLAFTSDKEQLLRSVQNIRKDFFSIGAARIDSPYQHMLAMVRYFNESLRQMPGRKSLIWISRLTRMPPAPPKGEFDDVERRWRLIQAFDSLADEMLHTGVNFHTMDIKGIGSSSPLAGTEIPLSEKTGGLFLENDNFFVDGIGQLEEEMKGYYLLTYIPPTGTFAPDGSEMSHKIDIKLKRWMSEVRYRDHIFTGETAADASEQSRDSLQQAVYSPFQNNDLSIRLSSGYVRDSGKVGLLRSWLHVDGENLKVGEKANGDKHIAVETLGVISDSNGRVWDEGRKVYTVPVREEDLPWIREQGLKFSIDIPVKQPGVYYVRVAVKDKGSGEHGSAYQYVEVPDLEKDRLTLSDIFISRGRWDEAKIEGVKAALKPFLQGDTIGLRTEVYNAKVKKEKSPELEYHCVFYKDGAEILKTDPLDIDPGGYHESGKITITRNFRLSGPLEPGTYMVQLVVRDRLAKEKESTAARWMTFELEADDAGGARLQSGTNGIETDQGEDSESMIEAFIEAAEIYRKELKKNPDSSAALKGLRDAIKKIRESLRDSQIIQENGEILKDKVYWIKRAMEWSELVEKHKPGMLDEAAVALGGWPSEDVLAIHYLVMYEATEATSFLFAETTSFLFKKVLNKNIKTGDIVPFLILEPNQEHILRQAGFLYTDIAILQLDSGSREGTDRIHALIFDGRDTSQEGTVYWQLARQALNVILADSGPDTWIRKWFAATSAYLLGKRQLSYAELNLKSALPLFSSDSQILFYRGVLHETYAAPEIQNARDLNKDALSIESRKSELKAARTYFKRSVKENPEFFEGWLHLGRVRGLLGDHKRAIKDLTKASEGLTDPQLQYYCALFLGEELTEMNRQEEGRAQCKLASTLYPTAQAPLLCLSRLDRIAGNFEGALTAVKKVFSLSAEGNSLVDPLQVYDVYSSRNVSVLLSDIYDTVGEQTR